MFNRNELANLIVWPAGKQSAVSLMDEDGLVLAQQPVTVAMTGHDLQRIMVEGLVMSFHNCFIASANQVLKRGLKSEHFSSVIQTERSTLTPEDRLARLEKMTLVNARRNALLAEENKRLKGEDDADVQQDVVENIGEDAAVDDEPNTGTAEGADATTSTTPEPANGE